MIIPKNEQGVVVLFENMSKELGFDLVHVQTAVGLVTLGQITLFVMFSWIVSK